MLKQKDLANSEEVITLEQRRAFLKLPLAERAQILSKQAEEALEHYMSDESVREREVWQGGDLVEQ